MVAEGVRDENGREGKGGGVGTRGNSGIQGGWRGREV